MLLWFYTQSGFAIALLISSKEERTWTEKSAKQIHSNRDNHILQRTQSPNHSFALSIKQQQKPGQPQEHCLLCYLIERALLYCRNLATFSLWSAFHHLQLSARPKLANFVSYMYALQHYVHGYKKSFVNLWLTEMISILL